MSFVYCCYCLLYNKYLSSFIVVSMLNSFNLCMLPARIKTQKINLITLFYDCFYLDNKRIIRGNMILKYC
ncbi:unnamed protein product [Callosobruchus maculatus]|uniref:Uncharacterized protein n=1 Tax=Callosobruchus maculatus TaxID=64391 RepID=A0A653BXN2_CALMS|nr:unnamed protein product [Callosobruchus maculatus]